MDKLIRIFAQPIGFAGTAFGIAGLIYLGISLASGGTDQALSDITELPIPLNVTWFAQPMDKAAAVAFTRQRLAWIDKEIIEEQRSAVQKGYDFSILPQELKYSKEETEDVIDNLQNKNQRLYVFTGLFYTYAPTKKQLDNQVLSIISAARQNSIEVSTYEYRQRQGFNSILPLGHNHCEISRMSTTAEVSILMPFATMELDDKGGNYYGQNKHSSNLIFCNRKLLASPMGFVCGKTGSGKGMAVKTEMTGTILSNPTDEIYIIDRAGEYTGISSRYGGVTYNFAVDSDTYLNPFDTVSVESLSPDAQLAFKIDAMLAQAGASAAEAGRDLGEEDQSIMNKDGDYVKAVVRARWDLASMQFTRAATLVARKKGFRTVVRQGRLKSVMVKLTGDQLKAYNEYVRKPFYEARFKDENGNIFARKTDDPEDIRFDSPDQVDLSQLHDSAVVEDSRGKKHTAPGKLLDLAGLSAILAKQGFKPANVLKTYQEMYENQIVSYPRTEDKEVTPEQFGELLPLVDKIASVVGVDTSLLSHRAARKTHVKEGGAHGANRPGINVPESLAELENGYGKIGSAIYSVLAKNYLAMLAEDYEYELIKGHVRDFPEYVGQTQIPIKPGFKAIFDSDSSSTEKSEGEEAENACEFGKVASPYVHEGANKRPQKPTMKWLTKKLEKYNVGTGATRTSTLAEITANEERALMKENKGALTMTKCGEVSYALLANCQIASPEVTEKLFESMNEVGRFSRKPSDVINTVTDMVVHDMKAMQDNIGALDGMKLGDGNAIVIGKCPKCGKDLYATKNQFRCAGVHFKKTGEKDGKAVFAQDGTCDFSIYRFVGPKDKPKKLTDKNGREIAEKGKTSLIKGIKKKSGDGTYDAYLTLNRETWSLDMKFPEFKGKKHKG